LKRWGDYWVGGKGQGWGTGHCFETGKMTGKVGGRRPKKRDQNKSWELRYSKKKFTRSAKGEVKMGGKNLNKEPDASQLTPTLHKQKYPVMGLRERKRAWKEGGR